MSGIVALAEAAAGATASALGFSTVAAALGFGDFAALGNVSFMMLGSPEELSRTRRTVFAKLPVVGARPVTQWVYDDLEQLTMGVRLHNWWCDPDSSVALLDAVRLNHQAQPLVFGAGLLAGFYVITEFTITDQWRYSGIAQHIDCRLVLQEWQPALPPGAPSAQPPGPVSGVIGAPAGLTAIYAAGATLGLPLPTLDFANTALSVISRAGAL